MSFSPMDPPLWTSEAQTFVKDEQERQYRDLATDFGLGNDPMAAYRRLSHPMMPYEYASPDKFKREYSEAAAHLTPDQWSRFQKDAPEYYQHYASFKPPTPYEDASRYALMMMIFDGVRIRMAKSGDVLSIPFLATLPSGDMNANVLVEPVSGKPIVFYEHGLFQFLNNLATCTAWAVQPLTPEVLSDDSHLATIPSTYTMPEYASAYFADLLAAYVINGDPSPTEARVKPAHNIILDMMLLNRMESFVMTHEMRHLIDGDLENPELDKESAWAQEYRADTEAAAFVAEWTRDEFGSWAFGFWSCYVALTGFHLLDRAIALLAFPPQRSVGWRSTTHPAWLSRRGRLRNVLTNSTSEVPRVATEAAETLCRMTDSTFSQLWQFAAPLLTFVNINEKRRPSPLWRKRIMNCFEVPPDE